MKLQILLSLKRFINSVLKKCGFIGATKPEELEPFTTTRTGLSPKTKTLLSETMNTHNPILDDLIYKECEPPKRTHTKMPPVKWRESTEEELYLIIGKMGGLPDDD